VPTYQYRCTACAEPLEVVQSFTDDPLTECPDCGGELRKVFSSVGIVFKGSGFYRTDSRSSSDRQSGAGSPTKTEPKTETKSDSGSSSSGETKKSESTSSSPGKDSGSSTSKTSAA
jgi:putative FmdB family regulatory protein